MKNLSFKNLSIIALLFILISTFAFVMTGCGTETAQTETPDNQTQVLEDGAVIGEGATSFNMVVIDADGNSKSFMVNTDKENVGDALVELNLIAGEKDSVGLFVTTVNGITYDYYKDGLYWSFQINDELASTAVDKTKIEDGVTYTFKATKG